MLLLALAISSVQPATSQPPGPRQGPGWYLVEYRGNGIPDLVKAGPLPSRSDCRKIRDRDHPPAPKGHPELDPLDCVERLQPPPAK